MEPWYKVVRPREEVRTGRSFNPDEFAIHLEQVVANTAPDDYKNPEHFFSRTFFTRALQDHAGMVLRRLSGQTQNTAPVLTLITQFGGGKTHTLTALYHIAKHGKASASFPGVSDLISHAGISTVPQAAVAVFVGNAWDPQPGRETPWIDIARQLSGDKGVSELGTAALTTPPGTEALGRVFAAANAPVLILFDEVLNFLNRHRKMADAFHAFIQNLTVATTGTTHGAAVISLPRSQVEMTDWDMQWQDRITKVVRRVAKDLIANDETEISEVVRRRLFEDLGNQRTRNNVSKAFADWCFDRRAQLPPEWTAVDASSTETKAREFLRSRFEACYPFHPATLSVFQRKWQALSQYQQTRGTLAMLAQWISWAYREGFTQARREPLITIGSAPLEVPDFRSVVLGQLGESRLVSAIESDISGDQSHARALDVDTKDPLRFIHRRVGTTIFFESSGGQIDKVAHLPELRFALGEPEVDTTSIDSAAFTLEDKSYFIRKVGTDGFRISHQPTVKKVVNDRRASLDEESEIKPAMRAVVQKEFQAGTSILLIPFPADDTAVQDTPRLSLILMEPEMEWTNSQEIRRHVLKWSEARGKSPRLYPGALIWCFKKPGRELREKVELWLAWKRVAKEVADGVLGGDFDRSDRAEIQSRVVDAEEAAKDEVWGGYRYVVLTDPKETDGLAVIDLGAGHSSSTTETLCGRIIAALKAGAKLNESIGAGYIDRYWPPALKDSGAWPLAGLRQSFVNGSLTRLMDPDTVLRNKIVEFVGKGDFGLASGPRQDGTYERVWFSEMLSPDEVSFDPGVFLLTKAKSESLKSSIPLTPPPTPPEPPSRPVTGTSDETVKGQPAAEPQTCQIRLSGAIPPEIWNRLGTKIIPKLKSGTELRMGIEFSVTVDSANAKNLEGDLRQILEDLGLTQKVSVSLEQM